MVSTPPHRALPTNPPQPTAVTFVVPGQVPGAGDIGRGVGGRVWPAGILVEGSITDQLCRSRGGVGGPHRACTAPSHPPTQKPPEYCPLLPGISSPQSLSDHPTCPGPQTPSRQPGSERQLRPAAPPWTHRVYNLAQTHPVSTGFLPSALLAALPLWRLNPNSVGTLPGPSQHQFCGSRACSPLPCAGALRLTTTQPPGSSSCPHLSLHPSDRPEPST